MLRTTLLLCALCALLLLAAPGCGSDEDDTLVMACLKSNACDVRGYPRISNCVEGYRKLLVPQGLGPVYDPIFACAAAAKDCDAVRRCYGVGAACDSAYAASCTGGKALFCDLLDGTTFTLDCGAAGLTCAVDSAQAFAATCTGGGTSGGLAGGVACGDGTCEDTGETCQSDSYDRCNGEKLEACLDGRWVRFDCKALGLSACYTATAGFGSCGSS